MIKLTGISGDELYLNPDRIIGVYPGEGYASIHADGESTYGVKESPEEVVQKIISYKTGMIAFNNYNKGITDISVDHKLNVHGDMLQEYAGIRRLAGLEVSNDNHTSND